MQREYIGYGSLQNIEQELKRFNSRRIFLVTGKESYSACGAEAKLDTLLAGLTVCRFSEFTVNPKLEQIKKGIDIFKNFNCDTIVAVGGGSVIDTAKAVNYLHSYPSALERKQEPSPKQLKPLIAVPTTAGSGSEATCFAVIYADKQKHSLDDQALLPKVAIVEPELTMSLPKKTTAVSGLDAFSQAVESYWSINSTSESKKFAAAAIKSILAALPRAVNRPNRDSRLEMAQAAHLAGKAINITRTTAAHAISYPMTSYFGVEHGQAVGITLASLLLFNSNVSADDVLDERGPDYVRTTIAELCELLGAATTEQAAAVIDKLILQIGLDTKLSSLGLKAEDLEIIVTNSFDPQRVARNPRELTAKALREILHRIF